MTKGRRIRLADGQAALMDPGSGTPRAAGVDPPLQPQASRWRPKPDGGTPHPQLGLFPHDVIRDGQKRFARDVTLAVAGGRHLVAQAPTGIGKTAASLAPAVQHALAEGKTVLFLTSRQSQHRIAVDTLRQIQDRRGARFTLVDLVAKRDMCLRREAAEMHPARFPDFCATETRTRSCPFLGDVDDGTLKRVHGGVFHTEELMQAAKEAMLCPHMVAMEAAKHAHVVVADYNHLFSDIRERSLERLGVRLGDLVVIVDEAHNLPERIRQNHAHRVTPFLLDRVEEEARAHKARDVVADVAALRTALRELADAAVREGRAEEAKVAEDRSHVVRLATEDLHAAFEAARNRGTLGGLHRTLQDTIDDLAPVVKKAKQGTDAAVQSEHLQKALEDWGRFRTGALRFLQWEETPDGPTVGLHVRLLDPAVAAGPVFDHVHSAVLMSGTLEPPEMARDLLGLEEPRTAVRRYVSPFPAENRPVCVARGYTTRYRERGEALWDRIAKAVADVCRAAPGNVAVFAPSYAILRDVRFALGAHALEKETIEEEAGMGKAERDRVLDTLRGARKRRGAVLLGVLGGSFSEGVDYKDNLLQAVVVIGLPLAPPDLEVEASIGHFEKRFPRRGRLYGYIYPAMNKVLQALGRGVRSETDRCAVVLLDERYLSPPYRGLLPALPAPVPVDDPATFVRGFLAAGT